MPLRIVNNFKFPQFHSLTKYLRVNKHMHKKLLHIYLVHKMEINFNIILHYVSNVFVRASTQL